MPNAWFRMYAEFADDPKVQMMSEAMQRRLTMLFCLRCLGKPVETFRETEIAFKWRISMQDLAETKELFLENGFIDEKWNVLNWNKRQYVSDSSTERVRQHRERLKQDETLQETEPAVTVTPPEQIQSRTDTEQKEPELTLLSPTAPAELFHDDQQDPIKTEETKTRHAEFKESIKKYWIAKNPGVEMPWGPSEGKNLAMWLKESPTTTVEQFTLWLRNRFKSDVNHTDRPSRWIGNVTKFANGAIDQYGNLKNGNGGKNAAVSTGKTDGNMAILKESLFGTEHQSPAHEDGLFSSGEDGENDARIIHGVFTTSGPPSLPGGDGLDF